MRELRARAARRSFVVEEKRPFLEMFVKDVLYGLADAPRSRAASATSEATSCCRGYGELDADLIARALDPAPSREARVESVEAWLRASTRSTRRPSRSTAAPRTPFFCSGCPHNRSTEVPEGSARRRRHRLPHDGADGPGAVGSIAGVHPHGRRGRAVDRHGAVRRRRSTSSRTSATAPTSTRAAWRSGRAVAAGVNITYKLLYNGAVAMTGGQDAAGRSCRARAGAELLDARACSASSSPPTTPSEYRGVALPGGVEVWDRDAADRGAARCSPHVPGVTVLIHDQECAAELRRARKRGKADEPDRARRHQRARLRGLRRLRREVQLPVGRSRSRPSSGARRDPPDLLQQGLLLPRGRLPVVPHGRAERRAGGADEREADGPHPALDADAARARAERCRRERLRASA